MIKKVESVEMRKQHYAGKNVRLRWDITKYLLFGIIPLYITEKQIEYVS